MHFGAVQDFLGLNFTTEVRSDSNIAAIVGRNGAGKSRLLQAISDRKVEVFVNGAVVQPGATRLWTPSQLQPGLTFTFDPVQHREQRLQAIALYNSNKKSSALTPSRASQQSEITAVAGV